MLLFLLSLIYKGVSSSFLFFFIDTATTEIYTLSLHDALPIFGAEGDVLAVRRPGRRFDAVGGRGQARSEEHTSELQSQFHLVCRLLLEKKKISIVKIDLRIAQSFLLRAVNDIRIVML